MSIWNAVKNLKWNYVKRMFFLFLKHPIFAIATCSATFSAYKISQKKFPNNHGGDNKENAFRHAIWNILIAKNCAYFSNNEISVLRWTKKFTDLHELLAPNETLSKQMDLKNNEQGRLWFFEVKNKSIIEIENFLILKLDEAVKISTATKIEEINNLVFLKN